MRALPPPTFVKLAEGRLTSGQTSPIIQVSGYADLILYVRKVGEDPPNCNPPFIRTLFRPDGATPFSTSATAGTFRYDEGGRIRVEGVDMQLHLQPFTHAPCPSSTTQYVVAGVK